MDPKGCLLPEDEMPDMLPQPKVRVANEEEWNRLVRTLVDRGIVTPVAEAVRVKGRAVKNGMFGVEKVGKGKDLPDGRTAQRQIMDLRPSNAIIQVLTGNISSLSGAPASSTIGLEENQIITISGHDLVSSYLFQLPNEWPPFLTLERPVEVSWPYGMRPEELSCHGNWKSGVTGNGRSWKSSRPGPSIWMIPPSSRRWSVATEK